MDGSIKEADRSTECTECTEMKKNEANEKGDRWNADKPDITDFYALLVKYIISENWFD